MPPTLADTFRALSSFSPPRRSLADAPWEAYVDWAIANGLAALAAYNLEYRLAGGDAPQWVRDQLLSVYQGTANDNVMKLVNFKRVVGSLEGRRVILFGGAAFAEALYPHIAFRPIIEISLLVRRADLEGLVGYLSRGHFKTAPDDSRPPGVACSLTDGRTSVHVFTSLFGSGFESEDRAVFERAAPMALYGPSFFRLAAEDAVLALCLEQARAGYEIPYVSFVDLRELLLGAPASGGRQSRAIDLACLRARANSLGLDRSLYVSCGVAEALFPETAAIVATVKPQLPKVTRWILDGVLVHPLSKPGRTRALRGAKIVRRVLARRGMRSA